MLIRFIRFPSSLPFNIKKHCWKEKRADKKNGIKRNSEHVLLAPWSAHTLPVPPVRAGFGLPMWVPQGLGEQSYGPGEPCG